MKRGKYTVVILGSHSALDVCRGAKAYGFKTLVVTQKGRGTPYQKYYKTNSDVGCVDECLELTKFSDLLKPENINILNRKKAIFIPHRSFEVYLNFDYSAIEQKFNVPFFGNKYLLKIEERGTRPNQYDLMDEAGIRYPKQFKNPRDIDRLCLVKVSEKERGFERAFFLVNSYADFKKQTEVKLKKGVFTKEQLSKAVIEEFVMGVQVNLNFFYSKVHNRLELIGTDTRRQTNLEGMSRIPARFQEKVFESQSISYEEAGHVAVTILESLLEQAYALGEKFVKSTQKLYPPGIIGPFALQTVIIPGPPKKEFVTFDVSPRMPGSPGIGMTPYSGYLFGESMSMGKRVAKEIYDAVKLKKLKNITT